MAFLHLTGLLKVTTATVGIRGTVFDLACGKADATDNPPEAELTDAECNQSPFASTRAGEVTLASADRREVSIPAGQVVLEQSGQTLAVSPGESAFAGQSLAPIRLASTPNLLDRDPMLSSRVFNFNICRP